MARWCSRVGFSRRPGTLLPRPTSNPPPLNTPPPLHCRLTNTTARPHTIPHHQHLRTSRYLITPRRRYFRLLRGALLSYADAPGHAPKATYDLHQAEIALAAANDPAYDGKGAHLPSLVQGRPRHRLAIHLASRPPLLLEAATEEERAAWLLALRRQAEDGAVGAGALCVLLRRAQPLPPASLTQVRAEV